MTEAAQLRHLRLTDRALRAVIAAPYALFVPMLMTIDHYGDSPLHPAGELLLALGVVTVICLAVFAFLIREWAAWSYEYRHGGRLRRPIDWDHRWDGVRRALENSGLDIDTIAAYAVFRTHFNLETLHPPSRSLGVLGVFADWGARHNRKLIVSGATAGVAIAVAGELWPGWYDRPPFWIGVGVATTVLMPFAIWNGWSQYRLNARRPESVVLIPTQWRSRLSGDTPTATAVFLHEVSHVRHHDVARRRVIALYAHFAQFGAFLNAGMAFTVQGSEGPLFALFVIMAVSGILAVRRARTALLLVEELRADAEACTDEPTRKAMHLFLDNLPTPTRQTALRSRVLTTPWKLSVLFPAHKAIALMTLGNAVPLLTLFTLLWTGTVPPAPDL
ncbi:M48 family metalloprotease [Actinomadura chibensis]|uniref:M48 family metalloprotease n=1 Tax=Actinomadura chibensis TaxID=392828 RepID=A0A5D0NXT7_9ACTN|nr:M48 family metalloprotease [Actinomadura chibensis]TYB49317.1 M48 family metalloprotease [Actinomadura chibensis]